MSEYENGCEPIHEDTSQDERDTWAHLDGKPVGGFKLEVGRYGNGRVAIEVHGPEGPECKLTHNLWQNGPPPSRCIHVRSDVTEYSPGLFGLVEDGILEDTGQREPYGPFGAEAHVYRLAED